MVHLAKAGSAWKVGQWPHGGLAKSHGLQGPIGDAFNSRFLAVYGKGDRELAIADSMPCVIRPAPLISTATSHEGRRQSYGRRHSVGQLDSVWNAGERPDHQTAGAVISGGSRETPEYLHLPESRKSPALRGGVEHQTAEPARSRFAGRLDHAAELLPDYVQITAGKIVSGGHFDSDWKYNPSGFVAGGPPRQCPLPRRRLKPPPLLQPCNHVPSPTGAREALRLLVFRIPG